MFPAMKRLHIVIFTRNESWDGHLLLPDNLPESYTVEDVLRVLNDERLFIPVSTDNPPFLWLVNKATIKLIRWSFGEHDTMETRVPWDRRERVKILLDPEGKLNGYLVMIHPRERSIRVQELVNAPYPHRFIVVIDQVDPIVWFVNKVHIQRIGHIHD